MLALANGIRYCKDLCNEPSNYLTPEVFAQDIKRLSYLGLDITILDSEQIKQIVISEQREGKSVWSLSKKYGISRYAIQAWCGLRPEVNIRKASPLKRGRPTNKPETLEKKVKRLEMENDLLRKFLRELERQ